MRGRFRKKGRDGKEENKGRRESCWAGRTRRSQRVLRGREAKEGRLQGKKVRRKKEKGKKGRRRKGGESSGGKAEHDGEKLREGGRGEEREGKVMGVGEGNTCRGPPRLNSQNF